MKINCENFEIIINGKNIDDLFEVKKLFSDYIKELMLYNRTIKIQKGKIIKFTQVSDSLYDYQFVEKHGNKLIFNTI